MPTSPIARFSVACAATLALALPAGAPATPSSCLGATLQGSTGPAVFADGFESGDVSRWLGPVLPGFSALATVDLGVAVEVDPQTTGEHLLELRWRLPGGALYQSVAVPFADVPLEAATRPVDGYPFPVPVATRRELPAERASVAGSGVVESRLPLAGTSVVDSALWGTWSLEVFLDGAAEPCLPPLDFRLEP